MKNIQLIILMTFITLSAFSSSIKNLSIEQGLSNRRVLGSASDKKGYIWFATKTNIDRYDGEKFDAYKLSTNEKNCGIITNRDNNIYAFTERSVYFYDERVDDFKQILSLENSKTDYVDAAITTIYFDAANMLYIGTNKGVLMLNDKMQTEFKELRNISIYSILSTQKGNLYFGTSNGIIQFRKNANNNYERILNTFFQIFANTRIQSMYFDEKTNNLWIGTFANGLYIYDISHPKIPQLIHKTTLPIKVITDISGNEIWAGSDGEGIFEFNRFDFSFLKLISQSENQEENIGANGIYHILQADGNVWISTYTGGIYVINTQSIVEKQFRHQRFKLNSLINDHVNVIFEDSEGDLWFGTNNGLSLYYQKSNTWKHYLQENDGENKENSVILSIYEDRSGNMWVGGYATKLVKINKSSAKVTEFKNIKGFSDGNKSYIYSIEQDEEGNMWFGGSVDKLKKFNPLTNEISVYNIDGINKIFDYNSDYLFLATIKGLVKFHKKTGKSQLIDFRQIAGGEKLISFPFLNNIIRDKSDENMLLIGTEGFGLYLFSVLKSEISILNTQSGLTSDYIYGLLYDNEGKLWISTENGLNCYDEKSKSISSYFEFDGITDNTFNFLSYCRLRNGSLLFGTPKGVNLIRPELTSAKQMEDVKLHFKGFYLFYEKVGALDEDSPLEESIDESVEINLRYTQHTFSIDFIHLNISNRGRSLYSWKLDGFDDEWTQPSSEHKAIYTNIPSGKYKFMVKAISSDGKSESEVRTITIRKLPPFWASTYAYILYFALIGWLLHFLVRYWLNKVDIKLTQDKIQFFVSMAHEIRTPITLIKAPLNEIDNEKLSESGRSALELARKNTDKLFGLVTQLLDFQKIESDAMSLCVESTPVNAFIDNSLNSLAYLAKNKGLELRITKNFQQVESCWIDRNKMQMIIENLLTNAIKYTPKGGLIQFNTEIYQANLQITVSDNGIGIPESAQANLFKTFYRARNAASSIEVGTGIGLMFTKKLIELHRGTISFLSAENKGTTFRVSLPIEETSYTEEEIVQNNPEIAEPEEQEAGAQHSMHILLVEDNDELRNYLSRSLRKKFSIAEASNGREALTILEHESPDLILSDILMPEMDGFELCNSVKNNVATCHIPFILLTSLSDREDVLKGLSMGADDYITKPFDITILEGKINTIFRNRALYRKKYIEKSVTVNESNLLSDLNKNFMGKIVKHIEDNITNEEFNIDDLAYEMAMSRSVFFKKVKSLTGQNPKEFIRDIKMNKAADLLRDQKYSVSEIAYLIGFPNAKYFSTAFKKYYGMTPSMFVKKEKREDSFSEQKIDSEY